MNMEMMHMDTAELTSGGWKVLVVLDACRYDYFEKVYRRFFKGKLEKRTSPTTRSIEWLVETFKGNYQDTIYISANPFVTPKTEAVVTGLKFSAKEKFFKVVNVLEDDWDEELQMVTPEAVNRAFLRELKEHPGKRFILHYLQPHYPYVKLSMEDSQSRMKKKPIDRPEKGLGEFLNSIGLNVRTIKQLLGRPSDQMGYIMNKFGVERLREEYEANLVWVLEGIAKIVPSVKGRVVITSDHGEMLGEHGKLGHDPYLPKYKELMDVPYLVVER